MENVRDWLRVDKRYGSGDGYGYGSRYGDGYGYGSGYGDGSGSGYGDGYGSGDEDGSGSGYGYRSVGLATINGYDIFLIDNVPTIIVSIHLSLAKGYILNSDLTMTPCYVVKDGVLFAHGPTAQEAQEALRKKRFENMDTDEAIEKFCETFKQGERYPGHDFFDWHHYLTGSCEMGRTAFVRNRGIDLDKTYTVDEFIELTENDYGRNVIRRLKERYE